MLASASGIILLFDEFLLSFGQKLLTQNQAQSLTSCYELLSTSL